MSAQHSTRGSAIILERCPPEEWDQFIQGELTADDLRQRYGGDR